MHSSSTPVERAQPLLGTLVSIRAEGLDANSAHEVVSQCFAEIARVHRLMSFHEPDSDVSRLNRDAHRRPVRIDADTYLMLEHALKFSAHSGGAFDVTVAPSLVEQRLLPTPHFCNEPDPAARWSDIELLPDQCVRTRRSLWIDLSGIAKGFAVDRALSHLAAAGAMQACVNAGGDLAAFGAQPEWVRLDIPEPSEKSHERQLPIVELRNAGLASSGVHARQKIRLVDGLSRQPAISGFASVLAPDCETADALTKLVLVQGASAAPILRKFGATALMSTDLKTWTELR